MSDTPLPLHPRIGDHVVVRRHEVDGHACVVLQRSDDGVLIRVSPEEWTVLAQVDGTRDLDGILLAASLRGQHPRSTTLRGLLVTLHRGGLLEDGVRSLRVDPPSHAVPAERPLDVFPDFALHCDGRGGCCGTYGSVLFAPLDVARARALHPAIADGGAHPERAFTPARGVDVQGAMAVAMRDGACVYLQDNGLCAIHAAAGEAAKPLRCRLFPATLVDDGERVRVSVMVECACVLSSVGRPGGSPLVPSGARTVSDLEATTPIATLPETVAVSHGHTASRAEVSAWARRAIGTVDHGDIAAVCWTLAAGLDREGLGAVTVAPPIHPTFDEIAPWVRALAARARRGVEADAAWKSGHDRSRRLTQWVATAAERLGDPAMFSAACMRPVSTDAFYVRTAIHGLHIAGGVPMADHLRDRAVRILVARLLPDAMPAEAQGDPVHTHPIAAVEAVLRGHGVAAYVRELRP